MANEIQAQYATGKTLVAYVYYDDGGVMTLRATVPLTEFPVGGSLYSNITSITGLSAGDAIILKDETATPITVGGGKYKPTVVSQMEVEQGAVAKTITIDDPQGTPIADATCWITTDEAGLNTVRSGVTEDHGDVTFYLTPGTYYMFVRKAGYNFTNPTEIEVLNV